MTTNNPKPSDLKAKAIITVIFLLALLLTGLLSCKPMNAKQNIRFHEKDSVHTSVNYIKRDTTIVIPGDTLSLKVPIYNLSEVPTTIRTSNGLTLSLQKLNQDILATCNVDDLKKIIELQDKIIQTSRYSSQSETIEIPVEFVPKWTAFFATLGKVAAGIAVVFGALKFGKIV